MIRKFIDASVKYLKYIWRKFKLLLLFYLALWVLWACIRIFPVSFSKVIGAIGYGSTFFESWFASFTEDLFFFGLGFVGLTLSTKSLKDENFLIRVLSLANGDNFSAGGEKRLWTEIQKLLSINKTYDVVVKVETIDAAKENVYVHAEMRCSVANLCKDSKISARINAFVVPGKKIDGRFGYIQKFTVVHKPLENTKKGIAVTDPQYVIDGTHYDLNKLNGEPYNKELAYLICEDGQAEWTLSFETWVPVNSDSSIEETWFFHIIDCYTEKYNFTLVNNLNEAIEVNWKYKRSKYSNKSKYHSGNVDTENKIGKNKVESQKNVKIVKNITFNKGDSLKFYLEI